MSHESQQSIDVLGVQKLVLRARRAALLLLREHLLLLALGQREVQQVVRGHAVARRANLVVQCAVLQQEINQPKQGNVVASVHSDCITINEARECAVPCELGLFWSLVVQTRCSCCTARQVERAQQHAFSPEIPSCSSHFAASRASQGAQRGVNRRSDVWSLSE